jgi:hypothetical protein
VFSKLDQLATGRRVLAALTAVLALFVLANLTSTLFADATSSGIIDLSGGRNALDARSGLTADEMYRLIAGYGPTGRRDHLLITLLADLALPAMTFLFTALGLLNALRSLRVTDRWRRIALLLPAAYLVADYGENTGIITLLLSFPTRLPFVASATATLTAIKSILVPANIVAVLAVSVAAAVRARRVATQQLS